MLYETVKAVLSGATATAAVPAGQPDPLTATTSITTLSGGGPPFAAAEGVQVTATSTTAAPPIITGLNMQIPPTAWRTRSPRGTCQHRNQVMHRSKLADPSHAKPSLV
ncbi:hypothetical protein GCM10020000_02270 [Streptomyces olivoverticillatus]